MDSVRSFTNIAIDEIRAFTSSKFVLDRNYKEGIEDSSFLEEIPLWINDVNDNNVFDEDEEIIFYSHGSSRYYPQKDVFTFQSHPYDLNNYVWLVLDANSTSAGNPLKIDSVLTIEKNDYINIVKKNYSMHKEHIEKNNLNPTSTDFSMIYIWLWQKLNGTTNNSLSTSFNSVLNNVAKKSGYINVQLSTYNGGQIYPSGFYISINDNNVLETSENFRFSFSNLKKKDNSLIFGFEPSYSGELYLNWYEVEYNRYLKASDSSFDFFGLNGKDTLYKYMVNGFNQNDNIFCLDISDPLQPKFTDYDFKKDTLIIERPGYILDQDSLKNMRYLVESYSKIKNPSYIEFHEKTDYEFCERELYKTSKDYEYLIVTPKSFYEPSSKLVRHRSIFKGDAVESGAVIFVEDIYNFYSGGKIDPSAIRNFLFFASNNWNTTHVLLMGKGHFDIKNYLNSSVSNHVPVYETFGQIENTLVDPSVLSVRGASDDFYAGMNGRSFSFYIGRFPAKTIYEANSVVDKVIDFETGNIYDKSWKNKAVFIADDDYQLSGIDGINQNTNTHHMTVMDKVVSSIPKSIHKKKIYLQEYTPNVSREKLEAEADLVYEINSGSIFTAYVGHGSRVQISDEKVFTLDNTLPKLKNNSKYGLFWAASCNVGSFDHPHYECITEKLVVTSNKGMAAAIGASRDSYPNSNSALLNRFVESVFGNTPFSLGEALAYAKINVGTNNSGLYNLLGDPAMYLFPNYGKITIENIDRYDTLYAMEKIKFKGNIESTTGNRVEGKVSINLFTPQKIKTVDYAKTEELTEQYDILKDGDLLFSANGMVNDGSFNIDFFVPKEIPFLKTGGSIKIFSWYSGEIVSSIIDSIYFSGDIDNIDTDDSDGPGIKIFVGGLNSNINNLANAPVSSSAVVNENSVITVMLEDEHGIKTSGRLVNEGLLYEISGLIDRKRIEKVNTMNNDIRNVYFNILLKDELSDIFEDLYGNEYELFVLAQDNYNNRAKKKVKLIFNKEGSILNEDIVYNYPNPFSDSTRIIWQSASEADVLIKIYTKSGRLIKVLKSNNVNGPYDLNANSVWYAKDEKGKKVARGLYFYCVYTRNINSSSSSYNSKPYIGKMMKF